MSALALLSELRSRDIYVREEGDQLHCDAPPEALTPALLQMLRQRKDEILAFLRSTRAAANRPPAIVPLQPRGTAPPIFGVPGHNGDVFCFLALARHLGDDQPFYGLQPPGLDGRTAPIDRIEDLAAYFETQVRAFAPSGPFVIAGHCAGCVTAFELGRRFHEAGAALRSVSLFGAPFAARYRRLPWFLDESEDWLRELAERAAAHARALASRPLRQWGAYVKAKFALVGAQRAANRSAPPEPALVLREAVQRATIVAARRYRPGRFGGRLRLFVSSPDALRSRDHPLRWRDFAAHSEVWYGPSGCRRDNMLREPYARIIATAYRGGATACPASAQTALHVGRPAFESLVGD